MHLLRRACSVSLMALPHDMNRLPLTARFLVGLQFAQTLLRGGGCWSLDRSPSHVIH